MKGAHRRDRVPTVPDAAARKNYHGDNFYPPVPLVAGAYKGICLRGIRRRLRIITVIICVTGHGSFPPS